MPPYTTSMKTQTFATDENLFTWSKNYERLKLVGVEEASSLGLNRRPSSFKLKSHKTSTIVTFEHVSEVRDGDNDLVADVYVPSAIDVAHNPRLQHVEVHILND